MSVGRVVVLDYGAGNLRSVVRAVAHAGATPVVSSSPRDVEGAAMLVLPGVGAAANIMRSLRERGLAEPIREYLAADRPFLGICMGMQALLSVSEEGGEHPCLGVIEGRVVRLPEGLKVPHMGWNSLRLLRTHPAFEGIPDGSYFYFVHSYYAWPADQALVVAETEYGAPFAAVMARGNLVATQFHPEKSGGLGLRFYANVLRRAHAVAGR